VAEGKSNTAREQRHGSERKSGLVKSDKAEAEGNEQSYAPESPCPHRSGARRSAARARASGSASCHASPWRRRLFAALSITLGKSYTYKGNHNRIRTGTGRGELNIEGLVRVHLPGFSGAVG
jgi:hypothetical protein